MRWLPKWLQERAEPNGRALSLRLTTSQHLCRQRMRQFYLLPALLATSACTSVPVAVCPAVVDYTPGQQSEAADELLALPPGSILTQMLLDYHELREKLKTCAP